MAELFSINAATIFGLDLPIIKEGEKADLTLFSRETVSIFTEDQVKSRSKNNAFINKIFNAVIISAIHY
jgi:dihydroorotase